MTPTRPFRCFNVRIIVVALIAAALIVLFAWWGVTLPKGSAARILTGLGEVAAFGWVIVEMLRSIRRLDELEQRIHAEALAISAGSIVFVIGGWRFLEKAGLPAVDWPAFALPLLSISWAVSVVWIGRRYR